MSTTFFREKRGVSPRLQDGYSISNNLMRQGDRPPYWLKLRQVNRYGWHLRQRVYGNSVSTDLPGCCFRAKVRGCANFGTGSDVK